MPRKANKGEKVEAVQADELPVDLQPTQEQQERDPNETNWDKPISSQNPPPSKRPLREQHSPVSDGDETLQKDERETDEELAESERGVREATDSGARRTRVTDANTSGTTGTGSTNTTR